MKNTSTLSLHKMMLLLAFISCNFVVSSAQQKSPARYKPAHTIYFGYEISFAGKAFKLDSDIAQLQELKVCQQGATLGIKVASPCGGVRLHGGMYYSDGTVAHTVNMHEVTASGNIYLLRLTKQRYHTIEPYIMTSIAYEKAKFFGNYLNHDMGQYYSERSLGRIGWLNAMAGAGFEYQLENNNMQFVHLFAEIQFGKTFNYTASNDDFANTMLQSPTTAFAIGVSFGKIH